MRLSDTSLRNPVFAVMVSAAMVVFGLLAWKDLGISQLPEIDFPVVSIATIREASSPEVMDNDVTDVIEDAISQIEGIDYIQSQSLEGQSVVTVFFHLHRDIDAAMQDVQNAVAAAAHRLPADIDPPTISKINFNKFPVMWLATHGKRPLSEINHIVDTLLKQRIQTIPGCGGVMFGGLRQRNMRIWLRGDDLRRHGLDPLDVVRALREEHVERPAGYLKTEGQEITVRIMGEARTPAEFGRVVVAKSPDGGLIRLEDVADIEDGLTDRRGLGRFNRQTTVGMGVLRANGANVVGLCDEVKKRLPELRALLPEGIEIGISVDYSMFIREDIEEVKLALVTGICLTAMVTLLFLGSASSTLNVCVSIPTSLLGTMVVMKAGGFTLNFMTLLALSLSVGVVVDDAILVLENIYRRMEAGESRAVAARRGSREITFAALAATLSIAAIFLPVAFMKGAIGRFFFQFGITVTVAVLLSLVVSLTITPVLCARFLSVRRSGTEAPPVRPGWISLPLSLAKRCSWLADRLIVVPLVIKPMEFVMWLAGSAYRFFLRLALRWQPLVLAGGALVAAAAWLFLAGASVPLPGPAAAATGITRLDFKPIGRELVPSEDQNRFIVNVVCPVGSSLDYVDDRLADCERTMIGLKDPVTDEELVATVYSAVAIRPGALVSEGTIFVRLVPRHLRTLSQSQVIDLTRRTLGRIAGMRAIALDLSTQGFTSSRGYPVNFAIQGPDWETVIRLSEEIRGRLISSGAVSDVNSDYRPGMTEIHARPDRDRAADAGVTTQRLAWTLNVAFGGVRMGRFTEGSRRRDVRIRLAEQERSSPDDIDQLYIRAGADETAPGSALVPMADLVSRRPISTLPLIARYNHLRKVELTANMAPGISQGEAIAKAGEIARQTRADLDLPESYRIVQLGNAQAMQQTLESMWGALALGFIASYMILGIQFNSLVHPLTVLVAVPFGVTGALAVLWFSGDTLNLMSMIGMVLLAGLVMKNSIILVDVIRERRRAGRGLLMAVMEACPQRLRPILMTSLATMVAAVPMAFGVGPGSETRAPLARSILGGCFLSTLVTLFVVPVIYLRLERLAEWLAGADSPGAAKR